MKGRSVIKNTPDGINSRLDCRRKTREPEDKALDSTEKLDKEQSFREPLASDAQSEPQEKQGPGKRKTIPKK